MRLLGRILYFSQNYYIFVLIFLYFCNKMYYDEITVGKPIAMAFVSAAGLIIPKPGTDDLENKYFYFFLNTKRAPTGRPLFVS